MGIPPRRWFNIFFLFIFVYTLFFAIFVITSIDFLLDKNSPCFCGSENVFYFSQAV